MIYKVQIDNFSSVFHKIKELGDFCFDNKHFFISTDKDIKNIDYITNPIVIDNNNYKIYTNANTAKWCLKILSESELIKYEQSEDCQNKLKQLNNYMDILQEGTGVKEVVEEKCEKK